MTRNRFAQLVHNAVNKTLSVLEDVFDTQKTPQRTISNEKVAAEKTAALKALFESKAFNDALPTAQRNMIDGVNNVYRQ